MHIRQELFRMTQAFPSRYASFPGKANLPLCAGRFRSTRSAARFGVLMLLMLTSVSAFAAEPVSYPREVRLPAGKVTVHHPTVSDWRDFSVLSVWLPVEIMPDEGTAWSGSVMVQGITDIRFEQRLVLLSDLRPVRAVADESMPEAAQSLKDNPIAYPLLKDALQQARQSIALEYLLRALPAELADSLTSDPDAAARGQDQRPPDIMLSGKPAVLVLFDGPPQTAPIRNSKLEIVVNSPWLVFHDTSTDLWYLVFGDYWLQNSSLSGGSWQVAKSLPADIENLAMANGWESMKKVLPPRQTDRSPPQLKFSYAPAELVLFDGSLQMQALQGTGLQFAANADHDLFLYQDRYYLLLAGRWFSTRDLKGSWIPETELPPEFSGIPASSEKGHVLAAVPGTEDYRIAQIEMALQRNQREPADGRPAGREPEQRASNPGRQAYKHTYGYSGTWTADQGLKKGEGPTGSGSYYDPTYDPAQRDYAFWGAYGYGGYWPPYGYGARYYPARGAWGYSSYHDPFWGNPYPYPMATTTTIELPQDDKDWVIGEDGQKHPVTTGLDRNYIGSGTYQTSSAPPTGLDDPTAAGHWYSGPDGRLYRRADGGWQVQQGKKWVPLAGPVPDSVSREYQARLAGYASYQRFLQEQAASPPKLP